MTMKLQQIEFTQQVACLIFSLSFLWHPEVWDAAKIPDCLPQVPAALMGIWIQLNIPLTLAWPLDSDPSAWKASWSICSPLSHS